MPLIVAVGGGLALCRDGIANEAALFAAQGVGPVRGEADLGVEGAGQVSRSPFHGEL
jgi:hypothetical protein